MFKYARVSLDRSETLKMTLDVAPWEVPILAAVNGEESVAVIGETIVRRKLPDAGYEYDRLASKYKIDTDNGQSYVSQIYGVGRLGVEKLAAEIKKAGEVAAEPPVRTAEYSAGDDPLAGLFEDAPSNSALAEATSIEV